MSIERSKELRRQVVSARPFVLLVAVCVVLAAPQVGVSAEDYVLDTFGENIEEKDFAVQLLSDGSMVTLRSWDITCTRWIVYEYDSEGHLVGSHYDYYLSGWVEDYTHEFSSVSLSWPGGSETMLYGIGASGWWNTNQVVISSYVPPAFPLYCTISMTTTSGQTDSFNGTVNSFGDPDEEPRVELTSPPYSGSFRVTEHDFGQQVILESLSIDAESAEWLMTGMEIEIKLYGKEMESSEWYQIGVYTFGPGIQEIPIDDDITVRMVKYGLSGTEGIKLSASSSDPTPGLQSVTLSIRMPQVIVWTGGDGMDGHFISEWDDWHEGISGDLVIHVSVLDGDHSVEGATVFLDGLSRGQTDADGHLRFLLPIISLPPDPIEIGQFIGTVEATWNYISAKSEPTLLYEAESLINEPPKTLTPEQVKFYQWELLKQFIGQPEVPLPYPLDRIQTLIRCLFYWGLEDGYRAQAGDVVSVQTYKFTAPGVAPVWLVRETIVRDGNVVVWHNSWTENEMKYIQGTSPAPGYVDLLDQNEFGMTLASPAWLYVTGPDESHGGYEPSTGLLVRDFRMVISEREDEPFVLLIPDPQKGVYLIQVVPDPDALPTDTYSLEVTSGDTTIILCENVSISDVPENPYIIRVTETGITTIVSAYVDLYPDTVNLSASTLSALS